MLSSCNPRKGAGCKIYSKATPVTLQEPVCLQSSSEGFKDPVGQLSSQSPSPLTTHVLNTEDGVPASRVALSLHRLSPDSVSSLGTTDADGRCPRLVGREAFVPGMYKLRFETGSLNSLSFQVVFNITEPEQKFHLPLLMSRFSYSTYRGR
uniref:Transthyretin/hydroxyisourate hydrolase domain-containing protein n=1 Tax=Salarias fasciatus TaxID=181472 RepID=A0A672FXK5_SALFA